MPEIEIPGFGLLGWDHLVMDYNGTLAVDGQLSAGVKKRLLQLSRSMTLHVVTADTHGNVRHQMDGVPCGLHVLPAEHQAEAKAAYVDQLGAQRTIAMGNGRNDRLMLKAAVLGIALIAAESASMAALVNADLVCTSVFDALDLVASPLRLVAGLRS